MSLQLLFLVLLLAVAGFQVSRPLVRSLSGTASVIVLLVWLSLPGVLYALLHLAQSEGDLEPFRRIILRTIEDPSAEWPLSVAWLLANAVGAAFGFRERALLDALPIDAPPFQTIPMPPPRPPVDPDDYDLPDWSVPDTSMLSERMLEMAMRRLAVKASVDTSFLPGVGSLGADGQSIHAYRDEYVLKTDMRGHVRSEDTTKSSDELLYWVIRDGISGASWCDFDHRSGNAAEWQERTRKHQCETLGKLDPRWEQQFRFDLSWPASGAPDVWL
ncbi:MAG: hypothetical protein P8J20_01235 [Novosphingobium sp.]|nr:hypothetical protein [Novosphingobium sp.]